jgi:hypothetical protein
VKISLIKSSLFLFFMLAQVLWAMADVAPDPLYKGMNPVREYNRVQMVSQDVTILLDSSWCRVEADFVLHNRSRSPALMEVGFPTGYEDEVKQLRVFRNGKEVEVRSEVEPETWGEGQSDTIYHWVLWNMRFAPDERVSLRVAYSVKPRKNHDYLISRYRQHLPVIEEDFQGKESVPFEVAQVVDKMISYSTGYIMATGSRWHGPIEKAAVSFSHSKGSGVIRWINPTHNFTVTQEGIAWKFDFIEPDFDVGVEFNENATLDEEIALVQDALAQSGEDKKEGLVRHLDYLEGLKQCLFDGDCRDFQ